MDIDSPIQIESYPPEDIPTQAESDTFIEVYENTDENTESPELWARLVSISSTKSHMDLYLSAPVDGKHGVYKLGRSASADFRFNQKRISNEHCFLYCRPSAGDKQLQPYIEDNSQNGTYVNGTRLHKHVRRLLHSGDEVSLINPDAGKKPDGKLSPEVESATFYVHIFLPGATERGTSSMPTPATDTGGGLMRSGTVAHLLSQARNITDYYDVRELLGTGANGQVYRAIHRIDGHEVAVKLTDMRQCYFQCSVITDDETGNQLIQRTPTADKVLKEAHMLRSLEHPRIIRLEDVFTNGSTLYMVMEMVKGGDLFDRVVSKSKYDEEKARVLILQLLSAIHYLHSRKVAHRDLKPENILLVSKQSDVDIKVTDFGLAKSADEAGGLKTYCGTPQYFAPEVLEQQYNYSSGKTYSLEADMWSVGVITYALLCGSLPWSTDDRARNSEILAGAYSMQGPVWDSISAEGKSFISQLIIVNPAARLTASQALQHLWFDPVSHLKDRYVVSPSLATSVDVNRDSTTEAVNVMVAPADNTMPPPTQPPTTRGKKRKQDFAAENGTTEVRCERRTTRRSSAARKLDDDSTSSGENGTTEERCERRTTRRSSATKNVDDDSTSSGIDGTTEERFERRTTRRSSATRNLDDDSTSSGTSSGENSVNSIKTMSSRRTRKK